MGAHALSIRLNQYHHAKPLICTKSMNTFGVTTHRRNLSRINKMQLRSNFDVNAELESEIKRMRVKELKAELLDRKVFIGDVFEKDELVRRLCRARIENPNFQSTLNNEDENTSANSVKTSSGIQTSLAFISLNGNRSIPSNNRSDVFLRPSPGQFPALDFIVNSKSITMLVDTACSGIVLRPSIVQSLQLPTYDTPMTMTAAGGTNMGGGVSQLPNLQLVLSDKSIHDIRGPFPVAVQDIGALPSGLDGIIGLSFLSQYKTVDFNFDQSTFSLAKSEILDAPPNLTVVAGSKMQLTNMGIYIVDTLLDGRGPVKMLVDTGAASTILNWKGVADMGLSKSSPSITLNNDQIGAMGADNVALSLTHSYMLKRRFNFPQETGKSSIGIRVESQVKLDIGALPVLDALQSYGVGGILGSDLLMKSDLLRLTEMTGPGAKISLYQK